MMKGFASLRARARIGKPPAREDTFDTLQRAAGDRRRKTGQTEQTTRHVCGADC